MHTKSLKLGMAVMFTASFEYRQLNSSSKFGIVKIEGSPLASDLITELNGSPLLINASYYLIEDADLQRLSEATILGKLIRKQTILNGLPLSSKFCCIRNYDSLSGDVIPVDIYNCDSVLSLKNVFEALVSGEVFQDENILFMGESTSKYRVFANMENQLVVPTLHFDYMTEGIVFNGGKSQISGFDDFNYDLDKLKSALATIPQVSKIEKSPIPFYNAESDRTSHVSFDVNLTASDVSNLTSLFVKSFPDGWEQVVYKYFLLDKIYDAIKQR